MPSIKRFVGRAVHQLQKRFFLDVPYQKAVRKKSVLSEERSLPDELW